ncbi:MAG: type II secretion system protein [Smithella sp.]|nr:type II secretion system protein [Smithella sp.]
MKIFKLNRAIKNTKGFSLLEIIIVMIILAVVGMMAISIFTKNAKNRNLKEAAATYMSDIKLAKQRSMAESVRYRITINAEGNSYTVQDCSDADCNNWGNIYNATVNFGTFGSGVVIKNKTYTTNTFQPRGTCSAGTLELENSVGSTIRIRTTPMGRVRSEATIK